MFWIRRRDNDHVSKRHKRNEEERNREYYDYEECKFTRRALYESFIRANEYNIDMNSAEIRIAAHEYAMKNSRSVCGYRS